MRQSVRDAFFDFNTPLEGVVPWMYLDIKGLVTVGVGNLLPDENSAAALPFFSEETPDSPVDESIKRQGWQSVFSRQDLKTSGYLAFKSVSDLRLSDAAIRSLVDSKLLSNESILIGTFPEFPEWPADAQLGLLSLAWARGPAGFPSAYPNFTAACLAKDFVRASTECRLQEQGNPGVIPRNRANQLLFLNASKVLKPENGYDSDKLYYPTQLLDVIVVEGVIEPLLRDGIANDDLEELKALATVSSTLLKMRKKTATDLESSDVAEWKTAQKELLAAIAEKEKVTISQEDIIAIQDGIVVIDNIHLVELIKQFTNSDLEERGGSLGISLAGGANTTQGAYVTVQATLSYNF